MNVLVDGELINKYWKDIQVGDIVQIENNDFTPVIRFVRKVNVNVFFFAKGRCHLDFDE